MSKEDERRIRMSERMRVVRWLRKEAALIIETANMLERNGTDAAELHEYFAEAETVESTAYAIELGRYLGEPMVGSAEPQP